MQNEEKASVVYHDLFDYPLNFAQLIKWKAGKNFPVNNPQQSVKSKRGFYFLDGREGLIYRRLLHKRISVKKMKIAEKAVRILKFIPSLRMVAVTGSLAMENSNEESDIDLMLITKKGMLWMTRAFTYVVIYAFGFSVRKPNDLHQKDTLCLNMWLDETDLVWKKSDHNIYTAHELAQIIPIVNKSKTYEKLLFKNKWVLDFWPNSVRVQSTKYRVPSEKFLSTKYCVLCTTLEKVAYWFQYKHMKSKMTREIVTPTRALFHPHDWSRDIFRKLST